VTVRHRILHLSDTHLNSPDVDASAALSRILDDVRFVPEVNLVVVSGDLADDGSAEGCANVREQVGRFCAERGIPHVYCTGNHDTREAFAAVLGSGHLAADGTDIGTTMFGAFGQRAAVSTVAGLRVITLDSLVPGQVHGHVDAAQSKQVNQSPARNPR
jgi:3',5'-cyclic-AMP phosphodiesterase